MLQGQGLLVLCRGPGKAFLKGSFFRGDLHKKNWPWEHGAGWWGGREAIPRARTWKTVSGLPNHLPDWGQVTYSEAEGSCL